ncbi:hypothetical protein E8E11_009688 [Didymella keratinophila]|nr:hypothetical protein E8E11_009688 [Didymella keratinophila]
MAQTLVPGIDELSMPGGFLTWTIMTCVPEIRLTPSVFWEELLGQRERIRQAFKTTINVWEHRISRRGQAMRNIMWDESEQKCYIVDFEDYTEFYVGDTEEY